jgi:hypothetical protein
MKEAKRRMENDKAQRLETIRAESENIMAKTRPEVIKLETEKIRETNKPEMTRLEVEKIREMNKPEVLKLETEKIIAEREKLQVEREPVHLKQDDHVPRSSAGVRPATVEEVASGMRVNVTHLPGRRVIGEEVYCASEEDLRDGDIIHGVGAPALFMSTRTKHDQKHDPRVSYIAERVAYYREFFRGSKHKKKMFVLAKSTVATEEAIKTIPDIIYIGKFASRSFPRKLPEISELPHGSISCYVGLFSAPGARERETARALFSR